VQADAEVVHGGKRHRQHQGDHQRHHQAGAHTQREEADREHDHQRLHQHLDELAHAGFHRRRLIRHFAQFHAQLAHEAHARRGWIVEAALDLGHVGYAESTVSDANGKIANLLHRFETPGHAQLNTLAGRLEKSGGCYRVLRLQRLLNGRQWQAQRRQLGVGQFDPDLLVLQPHQLDLAYIPDPLQLQLQAVGVVLEYGVVETATGQRIDIAEGGAEFIVEERPLDTGR